MKYYTDFLPIINEITKSTRKIKKNTLAIPAALAAMPPKPNIAAIIAIIKKITVQRNMTVRFKWLNNFIIMLLKTYHHYL